MTQKPSLKLRLILFPIFVLPRFFKIFLAKLLARIWYYILKIRFEMVKKQIKEVYPNMTQAQVKRVMIESFENLLMIILEYSYFPFHKKHILKHTEIRNIENYEEALKTEKPVFLLVAHCGNGEISLMRVCHEGYPLRIIAKKIANSFLHDLLFEAREVSGLKHIPPKEGLADILKAIEERATLVFVHDQFMGPPKGVPSTFLGVPTYTNPAVAKFAYKNKALVVPVEVYRENWKTVIDFGKDIAFEEKYDSESKNIQHMTQVYNDIIGESINRRPSQWMWVHKRWKKRPHFDAGGI